jgi:hypothetical protein
MGLVQGAKGNIGVGFHHCLGAVAVMHIPIHNGDSGAVFHVNGIQSANGRMTKYAESHAVVWQGMMSRRAGTDQHRFSLIQRPIDAIQPAAEGQTGNPVALGTNRGISIQIASPSGTNRRQARQIVLRMYPAQVFHYGAVGIGGDPAYALPPGNRPQGLDNGCQPRWPLWVAVGHLVLQIVIAVNDRNHRLSR